MALTWKQAQEREADFWNKIYLKNENDIDSYRPVTDQKALAFTTKTLARFNLEVQGLRGMTVADVGCGPYGLILGMEMADRQLGLGIRRMYGIDPLMDVYRRFNTLPQKENVELITAKGEAIPVPDQACDRVFSINVVDHVENPVTVLEECRRLCHPDGAVCISVHVVRRAFALFKPVLFLVDRNHPHHFSEQGVLGMARQVFRQAEVTRRVPMLEDQPDFTFANIFTAPSKVRALKRWLSTLALRSVYLECRP